MEASLNDKVTAHRLTFWQRHFFSLLLLSMIPIAILLVGGYILHWKIIGEDIRLQLKLIADIASDQLQDHLDQNCRLIDMLYTRSLESMVSQDVHEDNSSFIKALEKLSHKNHLLQQSFPHVQSITLRQPESGVLYYTTVDDEPPALVEGWENCTHVPSESEKGFSILSSGPLYAKDDTLLAAVILESDLSGIEVATQTGLRYDIHPHIFYVADDGEFIFLEGGKLPTEEIKRLIADEDSFIKHVHPDGRESLNVSSVLVKDGLGVIIDVESDVLWSPIMQTVTVTLGFAITMFALSLLLARGVAGRLIEPLRQITRAANRLGEGDLNRRVPLYDDDVLDDLARAFNRMAENLQRSHEGLEEKVRERTAALEADIEERRRVEDALRESEARFRAVIHNAAVGVVMVSHPDGRYLQVNERWAEMTAYTVEELYARNHIDDITYPEDRDQSLEAIQALLAGEVEIYQIEKRFTRKDGSIFWGEVAVSGIKGEDGKIEAVTGMIIDITDQKHSMEALRESRAQLKAIFDNTQQAFVLIGRDHRVQAFNRVAARIIRRVLGRAVQKGDLVDSFIFPDQREAFVNSLNLALAGEVVSVERNTPLISGQTAWFALTYNPVRSESGDVIGVCLSVLDITERRKTEDALRRRERQYRLLFEDAILGIFRTTADGRLIRANPMLAHLFGYETPEAFENSVNNITQELYVKPEQRYAVIDKVLKYGSAVGEEIEYRRRDGSTFIGNLHMWRVEDNGSIYLEGFVEDITERKTIEDALNRERRLLRTVIDHLPVGIDVKDTEGRFLLANPNVVAFFGVESEDDLIGKTDFDFLEAAPEHHAREQEIMRTGEPMLNEEDTRIDLKGRQHWSIKSKLPLYGPDGDVHGIVGIGWDITELKRAQAEVEESRRFLESTLNALSAHICIIDETGTILDVNAAWRQFADSNGLRMPDYGIGTNYLAVTETSAERGDPEAAAASAAIRDIIKRERDIFALEYACHSPDKKRWFIMRISRFKSSEGLRIVIAHEDITERKLAEQALRESESKFRSVIEQSYDGIILADETGTIIEYNGKREQIMGIDREEAIGHPIWEIMARHLPQEPGKAEHMAQIKAMVERFFETGKADWMNRPKEVRVMRPDGDFVYLQEVTFPIETERGYMIGSFARDITDLKRADELMRVQRDIGIALSAISNLDEAFNSILDGLLALDDFDSGTLYMLEEITGRIYLYTQKGLSPWYVAQTESFPEGSPEYRLLMERQPRYFHNDDVLIEPELDALRIKEGLGGVAIIPLFYDDHLIAALTLSSHERNEIPPLARSTLESIASRLGGVIVRIRAQEALRESERQLARAQRMAHIGSWEWDITIGEYTWSDELYRILNLDPDDTDPLMSPRLIDFIHPEDKDIYMQKVLSNVTEPTRSTEYRLLLPDGTVRIVWSESHTTFDEDGIIVKAYGTVQDITERKQAEEALRESQEKFRIVSEMISDYAYSIKVEEDGSSHIEWVTEAYTRMTGYTSEEAEAGGRWRMVVFPDDHEIIARRLDRLYAGERDVSEFRIVTKSGKIRWLLEYARPIMDENGKVVRIFGAAQDITERKQTEEALERERNLLRTIIDNIPDSVYIKDEEGRFLLNNAESMRRLGVRSQEELTGKTDLDFFPPEKVQKWYEDEMALVREGEALINKEYKAVDLHHDGVERWLLSSKIPLRDSYGKVTGLVGITRDITDQKEAERSELELAVEREKVDILESFIGDASHDLRTPLTTMKVSLSILERAADNVDLRNRHLQTLKQQTTHLEILLEDMLNMLRLDRDSEFAQSRIYLNGVVASVIESQEVLAEQKGHEIIYERAEETESDPLVVMGDPVYLGHAVTNILKNAINYTPDPGTIRIRTRRSDGHAIIEIEDRGIGIAQEDLPHIFDRFFRADIARNADGGGTGLGLSIAKKIIEQHEGTIEVESAPSEGSTFRVVLPLAGMSEDQEETIS